MSNKPVFALGYALRAAGVPCAEAIAMMLGRSCKHLAGEPVEENRVEATPEAAGSYDTVVYCTKCGTELSRTASTIPKLELHGYLYNGIHLPPIYDTSLEYVVWSRWSSGNYGIVMSDRPLCKDSTYLYNLSGKTTEYRSMWKIPAGTYKYILGEVLTSDGSRGHGKVVSGSNGTIVWANYDVYGMKTVDGEYVQTDTIKFAKSPDPVPVYE